MSVFELIDDVRNMGIELSAADDTLRVAAPKGAITTEKLQLLKRNKRLILAVLSKAEMALDDYALVLADSVESAQLPPTPPYRFRNPVYAAAWEMWWQTLEKQRAYRMGQNE